VTVTVTPPAPTPTVTAVVLAAPPRPAPPTTTHAELAATGVPGLAYSAAAAMLVLIGGALVRLRKIAR
jgi:hypothetical protein